MRTGLAVLTILLLPALVLADEPPKTVTVAEAAKMVNEKVTVEMVVQSVGKSDEVAFLNSEADYKSAGNFTVFLSKGAVEKFKTAKVDDLSARFKGKTIQVTGTVILYRERPEIKVENPEQIKIVEKK